MEGPGSQLPTSYTHLSQQNVNLKNTSDLFTVQGRYEELKDEQKSVMQQLEKEYRAMKYTPSDPTDPYFYHIYEDTLPKENHYRIIPAEKDQKCDFKKQAKDKKFQRRYIFEGWDNYTDFEKESIAQVKQMMKDKYKYDWNARKEFGPRMKMVKFEKGQSQVENGRDFFCNDAIIIKYLTARQYKFDIVCSDLYLHLEWRQTNSPMAILNDKSMRILNLGLLYIHGRCKDGSPIVIFDMGRLIGVLKDKTNKLEEGVLGQVYNFMCGYIQKNMLVKGQVEKWLVVININKFSLSDLPMGQFKALNEEFRNNYIDSVNKNVIVNMTTAQTMTANFLKKFLDPVVQQRQIFCKSADPEELIQVAYPSQRTEEYGGTAAPMTKYWPPVMPPMTEEIEVQSANIIPRSDYIQFIKQNPSLTPMPQRYRKDLAPLE